MVMRECNGVSGTSRARHAERSPHQRFRRYTANWQRLALSGNVKHLSETTRYAADAEHRILS